MISEVFNIDCKEYMKSIPDKHFDLSICDPPYFSGPEKRQYYGKKQSTIGVKRVSYGVTAEWSIPDEEYFNELIRISKNYILWGANYFGYRFNSGRIVWDKINDANSFSDCEIAATDLFDHVRIYRFMWNGMLQGSISDGTKMEGNKSKNEKRIHPTQKPVQLYKSLLTRYCKPGFKIFDSHLGSGSHRIAAYDLGFDFYATELDPVHYKNQEKRFHNHGQQKTINFV